MTICPSPSPSSSQPRGALLLAEANELLGSDLSEDELKNLISIFRKV